MTVAAAARKTRTKTKLGSMASSPLEDSLAVRVLEKSLTEITDFNEVSGGGEA